MVNDDRSEHFCGETNSEFMDFYKPLNKAEVERILARDKKQKMLKKIRGFLAKKQTKN